MDSVTLCRVLPRDKVRSIRRECEGLIANPVATVQQLAHLLGRLSSSRSIQAVFPAPLYYRYLQQAKIQALRSGGHYESQVFLNQEAIEELQWRAEPYGLEWEGPCPPRPQNDNRERILWRHHNVFKTRIRLITWKRRERISFFYSLRWTLEETTQFSESELSAS